MAKKVRLGDVTPRARLRLDAVARLRGAYHGDGDVLGGVRHAAGD